jgi:hypothetical protein
MPATSWYSPRPTRRRSKRQTICSHPIRSSQLGHISSRPILITVQRFQRRGNEVCLDHLICFCVTTDGIA